MQKDVRLLKKQPKKLKAEKMKVEPVYFDSNKSTFTVQEKGKIDKLVNILKENSDYKVKVSGYADSQGCRPTTTSIYRKVVQVLL